MPIEKTTPKNTSSLGRTQSSMSKPKEEEATSSQSSSGVKRKNAEDKTTSQKKLKQKVHDLIDRDDDEAKQKASELFDSISKRHNFDKIPTRRAEPMSKSEIQEIQQRLTKTRDDL